MCRVITKLTMRSASVVALVLFAASLGHAQNAQNRNDQAPAYAQPAENLLIIVADIQRHINDDVYRFPISTDISGQNIFRASLVRLANYQALNPKRLTDVVALAKAQCLERLGSYTDAAFNFDAAAKSSADANIKRTAGTGAERARRFERIVNQPVDKSAVRTYERDMKKKIDDLRALAEQYKKTPFESQALMERERAEMQLAQLYITMRFIQPFTVEDAIQQIRRNISANANSKNLYTHHMMLGDLYATLAREYALLYDPDGPNFDAREFESFANRARTEYNLIQKADGFGEKLEARHKLSALESMVEHLSGRGQ